MKKENTKIFIPEIPGINELFEAGSHFGHPKQKYHPKSRIFVYSTQKGVSIIDLEKTKSMLKIALAYLANEAKSGKNFLFVGTKSQISQLLKETAQQLNMPYVNHKWLGGTLTNFETIKKNIKRLENMEQQKESEEFQQYTKKEKGQFEKQLNKLMRDFQGLKNLTNLPDNIFVVDAWEERIAIREARALAIPIIAITDTNYNPDEIDYSIPANDDVSASVSLVLNLVEEAIEKNWQEKSVKTKDDKSKNIK